jgi:hypothetical protein
LITANSDLSIELIGLRVYGHSSEASAGTTVIGEEFVIFQGSMEYSLFLPLLDGMS